MLICEFARRQLQNSVGQEVQLHTVEYLDGDPVRGRLTPRMIGFLNEAERDFFNLICSVDGIGVRKALRAMVRPVQEVATAIEKEDAKALSGLPGIGPATADRMIDRAVAYLRTQQESSGGWSTNPDGPDLPAITGLVVTGMILGDALESDDPAINAAVAYILSFRQPDGGIYDQILPSYNTSICLSALAKLASPDAATIVPARTDPSWRRI